MLLAHNGIRSLSNPSILDRGGVLCGRKVLFVKLRRRPVSTCITLKDRVEEHFLRQSRLVRTVSIIHKSESVVSSQIFDVNKCI